MTGFRWNSLPWGDAKRIMRKRKLSVVLMVPVGLTLASCASASYVSPAAPPPSAPVLSVPAEYVSPPASTPAKEEPKEEKRGNTPPGTDRTGGGPASGAILDPAGVVTKEPVLRDR